MRASRSLEIPTSSGLARGKSAAKAAPEAKKAQCGGEHAKAGIIETSPVRALPALDADYANGCLRASCV